MSRWRWRGSVALLAVALAFFIYPLLPATDVVNSDWTAFATGARLILSNPQQMYDLHVQQRYQTAVAGGRVLVSPGIEGILPFLAPAWVGLFAVPFDAFGTDLGGRLWMLCGLVSLGAGLYLAVRPRSPAGVLPAFAGVPTAVFLLNAQLDGFVALGLGAAFALWSRPYLAGLALGLTLLKPQLVLPLAVALVVARRWRVVGGWATAGVVVAVPTLILNPRWPLEWLGQTRATVAPVSREVDLPHLGVLLPGPFQTAAVAALTLVAIGAVVYLAARRRDDLRAAAAIVIAGGVLAAPHALPADIVIVSVALAVWGRARWFDWLALSVATLVAALTPAPVPAFVGLVTIGWLCLRAAAPASEARPRPQPVSAR